MTEVKATYGELHDALTAEFFDKVQSGVTDDGGKLAPRSAWFLKPGKSRAEFDNRHAALTREFGQVEVSKVGGIGG